MLPSIRVCLTRKSSTHPETPSTILEKPWELQAISTSHRLPNHSSSTLPRTVSGVHRAPYAALSSRESCLPREKASAPGSSHRKTSIAFSSVGCRYGRAAFVVSLIATLRNQRHLASAGRRRRRHIRCSRSAPSPAPVAIDVNLQAEADVIASASLASGYAASAEAGMRPPTATIGNR